MEHPTKTLPVVSVPEMSPERRLLWEAANYMEKHGKFDTGAYEADDGRVCIIGALMRAAGFSYPYGTTPRAVPIVADARALLEKRQPYIHNFNENNDQATVVKTLRDCAVSS